MTTAERLIQLAQVWVDARAAMAREAAMASGDDATAVIVRVAPKMQAAILAEEAYAEAVNAAFPDEPEKVGPLDPRYMSMVRDVEGRVIRPHGESKATVCGCVPGGFKCGYHQKHPQIQPGRVPVALIGNGEYAVPAGDRMGVGCDVIG